MHKPPPCFSGHRFQTHTHNNTRLPQHVQLRLMYFSFNKRMGFIWGHCIILLKSEKWTLPGIVRTQFLLLETLWDLCINGQLEICCPFCAAVFNRKRKENINNTNCRPFGRLCWDAQKNKSPEWNCYENENNITFMNKK